ncbi:hypothetical protein SS50377_26810 [Spironucleus salmonicida]|uniref:Smr domain-containing protein n=1 Tax=Spironucleus salmonicida TaxID=348837 RepID=V6LXK3_9EUKA|nr:hypothetical protein SS50377_26810 [Spironucleus salmonicida]|eukprot:EST49280.1 hypothetical protein SS50377_10501 [Spironucleus salmonicida]
MEQLLQKVQTDLDRQSLIISIQNALQSDDQESQLIDLLGFENIDTLPAIISNRHLFEQMEYEHHVKKDVQYYKLLTQQFAEVMNLPISEATYALQKYDWNINDAISAYAGQGETNFFIEPENQPDVDIISTEYVANCVIIDHDKPIKQFVNREVELDLHGYQVLDAIELFKNKYCELVIRVDDGRGNIKFNVIVGRGLHSDHSPLIKLHIMNLCKRHNIIFSIGAKGGVISIKIKRGMHTI